MILNWELVFFGLEIGNLNPQYSILKNTNPQFKITNWPFIHQLVISTFSSLINECHKHLNQSNSIPTLLNYVQTSEPAASHNRGKKCVSNINMSSSPTGCCAVQYYTVLHRSGLDVYNAQYFWETQYKTKIYSCVSTNFLNPDLRLKTISV